MTILRVADTLMKSEEVILTSAKAVCTLETGAQVVASWRHSRYCHAR